MNAHDLPMEQARYLFETIHLIRMRVFPKHCPATVADAEGNRVDLTVGQLHMLFMVHHLRRATLKELAEALGVSAPSASVMLDRLVEYGLVTREQNPDDRREVVVQMLPQGLSAIEEGERMILSGLEGLLRRVGPEVADRWCDVYRHIRAVLEEDTESGGGDAPVERANPASPV